jgi:TonB family protein
MSDAPATLAVDRLLDQRRARSGWARRIIGLAGAAFLHVGVVAVVMFGPQLLAKPPVPIEHVPVMLLPAPALGVPNPAPPRPEPRPPAPEPEPEPPPPPPPEPEQPPAMAAPAPVATATPRAVATPRPAATPRPQPRAPAPRPVQTPTGRQPSEQPPAAAPAGPPGPRGAAGGSPDSPFTASVGGVDNPNFTYGYYLDRMILLVAAQWVRPPLGGGVEAVLHFRVLPDGRVEDVQLRTSSGYSSFDLAALRAIQTAAPLPPLPRSYREGDLGVTLIFR